MHTALCTFDDRAGAEQARERLLQAGWDAGDIHLQHRGEHAQRHGIDPRAWEGAEHEIAVDARVVESITGFFSRMLGQGHAGGRDWADHVAQGRWVLCVDARDEAQARRAREVVQDQGPAHLDVVHRPAQRPLRDLVMDLPVHIEQPEVVRAGMHGRSTDWTDRTQAPREERAVANADLARAGLREPPADRPNREGWGRTRHD